jgi:hypothetical protein
MAQLSEWLQIMLAEIGRKQEEALRSAEEQQRRESEPTAATPATATTPTAASATPDKRIAAA